MGFLRHWNTKGETSIKKIYWVVMAIALATAAFAADQLDFTGTWKIDASKMDTSKGPPPRLIRTVTKQGSIITMTEVQSRDGRELRVVRKFSTDGSEVRSELGGQRVKSHGMWDGNKLVSDTTIGEQTTVHDVWTLSDDGQTWTDDVVFNGQTTKFVFKRQFLLLNK
jgi:hypothetical protein